MKKNMLLLVIVGLLFGNPVVGMKRKNPSGNAKHQKINNEKEEKNKNKKENVEKKTVPVKEHVCLEDQCAICLEKFNPKTKISILKCGHSFCNVCFAKALKYTNKCSMCRKKINVSNIDKEVTTGLYDDHKPKSDDEKEAAKNKRSEFSKKEDKKLKENRIQTQAQELLRQRALEQNSSGFSSNNIRFQGFMNNLLRNHQPSEEEVNYAHNCPDCVYGSNSLIRFKSHCIMNAHGRYGRR